MTTTAIEAEFAVVYVVRAMAVTATTVDGFDFVQRDSVAVVTVDVDVCARKRKLGLFVVIKSPDVPCDGVVAGIATILEISVMRVIITMTGDAVALFVGKGLRGMAIDAFLLIVHAVQRESGEVVIEKHRVLPVHFRVATLALGGQCALVRIVVQVARITVGHEFHVKNRFGVAIDAGDFLV
jgi:hypothetical protein